VKARRLNREFSRCIRSTACGAVGRSCHNSQIARKISQIPGTGWSIQGNQIGWDVQIDGRRVRGKFTGHSARSGGERRSKIAIRSKIKSGIVLLL
jgi:hypothetical protein